MRIPPNTHPIARLRNILLTVVSLLTVWMLLCLTSCATPGVVETAVHPTSDRGAMNLHEAVMRHAPIVPIPLTRPSVLMHSRFQLRV
ncbi:MAG: hypothetical protein J0H14_06815 [Alphaproteobacteria bacterium]|nr:hypothetical protein [Alphaproteobacteria bacterium]